MEKPTAHIWVDKYGKNHYTSTMDTVYIKNCINYIEHMSLPRCNRQYSPDTWIKIFREELEYRIYLTNKLVKRKLYKIF